MIKQQKITRLTICIIALVMSVGVTFATSGDDKEKDKLKDKDKNSIVSNDSIKSEIDIEVAISVDDTLVFEDWDSQEGGSGDDGGAGEADGGAGEDGRNNTNFKSDMFGQANANNESSFFKTSIQKEYQVEFTLYPNPTVDQIHIKSDVAPQSIRIIDITGKTHRDEGYSSSIDVAELPGGTYILNLIYADHVEARRFIKR